MPFLLMLHKLKRCRIADLHRVCDIYDEFHQTIDRCDMAGDLKWWENAYGTGMSMPWPTYEVSPETTDLKRDCLQLNGVLLST